MENIKSQGKGAHSRKTFFCPLGTPKNICFASKPKQMQLRITLILHFQ